MRQMRPAPKLGPAMLALPNDKWRRFATMYVMRGEAPGAGPDLVKMAGFGAKTEISLKVQAHRLAHDERMQKAIVEETRRYLVGIAPLAARAVTEVLEDRTQPGAARVGAARAIFDRAGMHEVSEQRQTVELRTDPEQVRRVASMAALLGLPAERLLGSRLAEAGVVIEGEAVEVGDDAG